MRESHCTIHAHAFPQVRHHNRVQAIEEQKRDMLRAWEEQDLKSARQSAWGIVPFLRLEARDNGPVLGLTLSTDGQRLFQVLQSPPKAQSEATTEARDGPEEYPWETKSTRDRERPRTPAQEIQRSPEHVRDAEVLLMIPPPLRPTCPRSDGSSWERHYTGDGQPQRQLHIVGGGPNRTATTLLSRQVVGLGDGVVGIVRVMLDPSAECHLHHPCVSTRDSQSRLCLVRCVIRAEVYLPETSTSLTLRIKLSEGKGKDEYGGIVPGHKDDPVGGRCEWRKRRLEELGEALEKEIKRREEEIGAEVQETANEVLTQSLSEGRELEQQPQDGPLHCRPKSNAFSILLVRANFNMPVRRVFLGSGSWRQITGEMVGSPSAQEMRKVIPAFAETLSW